MPTIPRLRRVLLVGSVAALAVLASISWPVLCAQRANRTGKAVVPRASAKRNGGPKKLALLIGINSYPDPYRLEGCRNDVADMRQVLIRRFGFTVDGIVVLLDKGATRDGILRAVRSHLIAGAAANPGTEILLYYSGHGSQVRDKDGDEEDGRDETLVPVDSDPVRGDRDITDDELDDLARSMARHTSNITFILDCCHSGTATRGAGKYREIVRDLPAITPSPAVRGSAIAADVTAPPQAVPASGLVTISGCRSNERAYETPYGSRHSGAMTYCLVRELNKATPPTSYRELMDRVANQVRRDNPSQNPQLEGAIHRPVLGGAAVSEDPFISIERVDGERVTVAAGAVQGLRVGMIVAIYDPSAVTLHGDQKLLVNAEVVDVQSQSAVLALSRPVKVPIAAKVVAVSETFSTEPALVVIDFGELDSQPPELAKLSSQIESLTHSDPLVVVKRMDVLKLGTMWDLSIRASSEPAKVNTREVPERDSGATVIQVVNRAGIPLYGVACDAADGATAERIVDATRAFVRQRNVLSLSSDTSSLNGRVAMRVFEVFGQQSESGRFIKADERLANPVPVGSGQYRFREGTNFEIEIENTSDQRLFVALLDISTDGSIAQVAPPQGASLELKPGGKVRSPVYRTTPPLGIETLKVIATTRPADFSSVLRAPASGSVDQRGAAGAGNPLEVLVRGALAGTRAPAETVAASNDLWTTVALMFYIESANRD